MAIKNYASGDNLVDIARKILINQAGAETFIQGDNLVDIFRKILINQSGSGGGGGGGTGDVVGPASSTDNALVRFSGAGGKTLKNSTIIAADNGDLTGLGTLNGRTIADWVAGPATAVAGNLAVFDGATGKLIADGGGGATTLVRAAAVITDNQIVRGDGGARGIQGSGITIADVAANNVTISGITDTALTLATLSNRNLVFSPNGTGQIRLNVGTGAVVVPSTGTAGIQLYNTADETTNFERLGIHWESNVALIRSIASGTGNTRVLRLESLAASGGLARIDMGRGSTPIIDFYFGNVSQLNGSFFRFGTTASSTVASGSVSWVGIMPVYNQGSGTAANTDLLVNRTETAVGSGQQNLIDLQVGGTSRVAVRNTGLLVLANQTVTVGAGAGTLSNAPVAGNPTVWLRMSVNGTTYAFPGWALA